MDYPFDREVELKDVGLYAPVPKPYGGVAVPVRKFNTPITPKENFERIRRGEKPLWLMNLNQDFNFIQPYAMADARARAFGGVDWFGIEWQYEEKSRAAMVKPGTCRLGDIANWREELLPAWPDLGATDWQKDYEENYAPLMDPDRPTMFAVVNGYFERLADLTGFMNAFCALLGEPEAIREFFNELDGFHIELMRIAHEVYHADIITFHDDMGSQQNAFFSPEVFRDLMLPHYRRITGAAHEMGMPVNFHSCGNVILQIPGMIESGFEFWEGQDSCNDKQHIMDLYGDRLGQVGVFLVPPDVPQEKFEAAVFERVHTLGKDGRYIAYYVETDPSRCPNGAELLYTYSLELYCGRK
jgi:hypothetical protein